MKKLTLPFVETMITQVCNLSCTGCTNYSDLVHRGYVPWQEGKQQILQWLERINIEEFGIMGGEPMINPEWQSWLAGVRMLLPDARLRFTTNGLLLHKYPDIVDLLEDIGNVTFKITIHVNDDQLNNCIDEIFSARSWTPVTEFGINRWQGPSGLRFQINRPEIFTKTYQNSYHDMKPWHSQPSAAFDNCCQQTCPLLYNGRIYKCSTAGLLKSTLERFSWPNQQEWQQYIDDGIGVNDADADVQQFVDNFGLPARICGQCPTAADTISQLSHVINVRRKNDKTML